MFLFKMASELLMDFEYDSIWINPNWIDDTFQAINRLVDMDVHFAWRDITDEQVDEVERIATNAIADIEYFKKKQADETEAIGKIFESITTCDVDCLNSTFQFTTEQVSLLSEIYDPQPQPQQGNRRSHRKVNDSVRSRECKNLIASAVFEELSGKHATSVTYDMCYNFAFKQICELEEIAKRGTKLESILAKKTLEVMESIL
jgi:hypothetical protein